MSQSEIKVIALKVEKVVGRGGKSRKIVYTNRCTADVEVAPDICKRLNELHTGEGSFAVLSDLDHFVSLDHFDDEVTAKAQKDSRNELKALVAKMPRGKLKAMVAAGFVDADMLESIQSEIAADQKAAAEKNGDDHGAGKGEGTNADQTVTA
jgi:hypothetical protein